MRVVRKIASVKTFTFTGPSVKRMCVYSSTGLEGVKSSTFGNAYVSGVGLPGRVAIVNRDTFTSYGCLAGICLPGLVRRVNTCTFSNYGSTDLALAGGLQQIKRKTFVNYGVAS